MKVNLMTKGTETVIHSSFQIENQVVGTSIFEKAGEHLLDGVVAIGKQIKDMLTDDRYIEWSEEIEKAKDLSMDRILSNPNQFEDYMVEAAYYRSQEAQLYANVVEEQVEELPTYLVDSTNHYAKVVDWVNNKANAPRVPGTMSSAINELPPVQELASISEPITKWTEPILQLSEPIEIATNPMLIIDPHIVGLSGEPSMWQHFTQVAQGASKVITTLPVEGKVFFLGSKFILPLSFKGPIALGVLAVVVGGTIVTIRLMKKRKSKEIDVNHKENNNEGGVISW